MLGNSTAIQRPKEQAPTNGAQKISEEKISTPMEHSLSHPHNVSIQNLDPDHLTLWQHPITTLHYFFSEVLINILSLVKKTLLYKRTVCTIISIILLFLLSGRISGPQQEVCVCVVSFIILDILIELLYYSTYNSLFNFFEIL